MIQNKTIATEEGHNITIRCEVKGNPAPTITWKKKGSNKLPIRISFTDNNKVLQTVNAKLEDSGEYICEAVNSLNTSRSATTVKVTRKLAFAYRQRGTLTANEKNNITLTCMYKDGLSPVSAMWTKDGLKINANKKTRFSINNQVMELRDLEMGHAGNYKCIIKSQVSQIQNTVRLTVRFLLPTCDRIRKSGQLKSGQYHINPTGDPSESAQVYCDMNSKPGEGITVISHDNEATTMVNGYSSPRYEKIFKYEMTNQQIKALKQNSKSCEQYVKIESRSHMVFYQMRLVSSSGEEMRAMRKIRDNCSSDRFHIGFCKNFEEKKDIPILKLEAHLIFEDFAYKIGKLKCY